jgi:hypothetical protein
MIPTKWDEVDAQFGTWKAYQDGFIAGLRGDSPQFNPYPKLTKEWRDWNKWYGWGNEILRAVEELEKLATKS